ncbi:MAG: holin [Pusillimonas sp.]
MRFDEVAVEAAGITIANKSMGVGAATGLLGFVASVNWLGVIGAFVAIVGLSVNIYFQVRRDRRESAESRARMEALKERL